MAALGIFPVSPILKPGLHTNKHTNTKRQTCTHVYTNAHTHKQACTNTDTQACIHTHTHKQKETDKHVINLKCLV